jgi:hypothetical protein
MLAIDQQARARPVSDYRYDDQTSGPGDVGAKLDFAEELGGRSRSASSTSSAATRT